MRTEVEIVARARRSPRVRAVGGLAVRETGSSSAHLISTAATPLGGDSIEIRVRLEPGATLHLRTVAAAIALPSAHRPDSSTLWFIDVGDGARLYLNPEPTVVAGGAEHHTSTTVTAHPDATVIIGEHAQLGRAIESPANHARARWRGSLRVDLDGVPMLRHAVTLGEPARGPKLSGDASSHRALSSVFRYPDDRSAEVSATGYAARLELVPPPGAHGATLTTALAATAAGARRYCDDLDLTADEVV